MCHQRVTEEPARIYGCDQGAGVAYGSRWRMVPDGCTYDSYKRAVWASRGPDGSADTTHVCHQRHTHAPTSANYQHQRHTLASTMWTCVTTQHQRHTLASTTTHVSTHTRAPTTTHTHTRACVNQHHTCASPTTHTTCHRRARTHTDVTRAKLAQAWRMVPAGVWFQLAYGSRWTRIIGPSGHPGGQAAVPTRKSRHDICVTCVTSRHVCHQRRTHDTCVTNDARDTRDARGLCRPTRRRGVWF